jgi:hypothetical protein
MLPVSAFDASVPLAALDDASVKVRPRRADAARRVVVTKAPDAAPPQVIAPDAAPAVVKPKGTGYFSVDSQPWATIYIDGRKKGVTPLFKIKLSAGPHRVKAVSATGKTKNFRITIRPNANSQRRLKW